VALKILHAKSLRMKKYSNFPTLNSIFDRKNLSWLIRHFQIFTVVVVNVADISVDVVFVGGGGSDYNRRRD